MNGDLKAKLNVFYGLAPGKKRRVARKDIISDLEKMNFYDRLADVSEILHDEHLSIEKLDLFRRIDTDVIMTLYSKMLSSTNPEVWNTILNVILNIHSYTAAERFKLFANALNNSEPTVRNCGLDHIDYLLNEVYEGVQDPRDRDEELIKTVVLHLKKFYETEKVEWVRETAKDIWEARNLD